jgi:hypothetical protein
MMTKGELKRLLDVDGCDDDQPVEIYVEDLQEGTIVRGSFTFYAVEGVADDVPYPGDSDNHDLTIIVTGKIIKTGTL